MSTLANNYEPEIAMQRFKRRLVRRSLLPTWFRNYIFWVAGTLAKSERQTPNEQR